MLLVIKGYVLGRRPQDVIDIPDAEGRQYLIDYPRTVEQVFRSDSTAGSTAGNVTAASSSDELEELSVEELKERLRDAGLPLSGTKAALIRRLRDGGDDGDGKDE